MDVFPIYIFTILKMYFIYKYNPLKLIEVHHTRYDLFSTAFAIYSYLVRIHVEIILEIHTKIKYS